MQWRRRVALAAPFVILLASTFVAAQAPQLVLDVHATPAVGSGSIMVLPSPIPGEALLRVDDGVHGYELWRTNGTAAGTTLLLDMTPGAGGSSVWYGMPTADATMLMVDRGSGLELWTTDGTTAGTLPLHGPRPRESARRTETQPGSSGSGESDPPSRRRPADPTPPGARAGSEDAPMTPFRTLPVLLALAIAAVAQDDRDRSTPTVSQFLTGQTALDLQGLVNTGWRFTDLEIESTSPWAFTVVAVANTGAYYKSWQYFLGVTASQLNTSATANNQRPIDVEPYDDNGTTRYCAISIANTGADWKTWTLFNDQPTVPVVFSTLLARFTNLERYLSSGQTRFAVVSVDNSTNNRNWTSALSRTQAQLAASSFRVYDLERNGSNSYDAIQIENDGTENWLYFDRTATQLADLQRQNLGRIVDIERHTVLVLGTRYDAVMLDNANELERRARRAFVEAPGTLGKHGFFLRQVNGPVLAEMMADAPFEPAGAMCSLYHVHAMKQVATGAESLATVIDKPSACGVAGAPQSLELTLEQMMENGDELAALAVSNHFGLANIDGSAGALGMASTDVNYTIGCSGPVPQSTMTLRDLSTLHAQVANGYLGAQRAKFYQLMPESLSFPGSAATTSPRASMPKPRVSACRCWCAKRSRRRCTSPTSRAASRRSRVVPGTTTTAMAGGCRCRTRTPSARSPRSSTRSARSTTTSQRWRSMGGMRCARPSWSWSGIGCAARSAPGTTIRSARCCRWVGRAAWARAVCRSTRRRACPS